MSEMRRIDEAQGTMLTRAMTNLLPASRRPGCDAGCDEPRDILQIVRRGRPIRAGRPVEVRDFDFLRDTIVFAYDPSVTPSPQIDLLDGFRAGEKVITMNGAQMVRISNAQKMTLADVNVIETEIAA